MKPEELEELNLLDEKKKKKQQKGKKRARKVASRKKKKKDDRCTRIAKRKYDVWPSAYASGAVVQCRRGKIWKGLKEEQEGPLVAAEAVILDTLKVEGGAAGLEPLEKAVEAIELPEDFNLVEFLKSLDSVGQHEDGDYYAVQGLEQNVKENTEYQDLVMRLVLEKLETMLKEDDDEGLDRWFKRKGPRGKTGGWVDCNTCRKIKKTGRTECKQCGREKGEKRAKYPSCRPTPGACKDKGKGTSWGKKSAKRSKRKKKMKEARDQVISMLQERVFLPGLKEHVQKGIPVHENFYRVGSPCFFNMFKQARDAHKAGLYNTDNEDELYYLNETNIGEKGLYEGEEVYLDFPFLNEAEYQGKKVELGKPKRGGSKKFYVYVKDGDKVKKVSFGSPDMPLRISNDKARASFVARHNCKEKKPRTSAGYWSCRIGRYPHLTGAKKKYTWW
jgi:hypothetical protein